MEIGDKSKLHNKKILIVGGGPAGTAAAIWAAKFGVAVTIVESKTFPRNRPGETLHPGIEPLFDQLGIKQDIEAAKFIRHAGIWVRWDSRGNDGYNNKHNNIGNWKLLTFGADEKGPWLGYQAWRATLDCILLQRAKRCGVRILQPCHALDAILDSNGIVVGLKTSCGNVMADFVIDAAGGTHWLARQLKLTIEKHSPPLFAYYGYAKGECPCRDDSPAIVITPEGWTWTAKVREHLYQWTRLYFNKNNNYNQLVPSRGWLPEEFKGLKAVEFVRGASVTWRLVVRPAGLGYFIVGDAAAVVDPSSAHGVLRALMSGIMASHAILRIVHGGIPSDIVIKYYNNWLSNWFFHDIERLKGLYRFKSVNV